MAARPPNTPRPIGSTDSFCPGIVTSDVSACACCAEAADADALVALLDEVVEEDKGRKLLSIHNDQHADLDDARQRASLTSSARRPQRKKR